MSVQLQPPQIFGTWLDNSVVSGEYTRMDLSAEHLSSHWRRNSLSSDYWAYHTAQVIPTAVSDGMLPRQAVQDVVSYLLNELFENCAKFSEGPILNVCYQSWLQQDSMVFQLTNHIQPESQPAFIEVIKELLFGDPDELYFQQLEENAEFDLDASGLGYLTLIKDFGIQFGFRFRPQNADSIAVDVQAHVSKKEI